MTTHILLYDIILFFFFLFTLLPPIFSFFFFNDTATTEIYTLSLHDALPISPFQTEISLSTSDYLVHLGKSTIQIDRKSTRLNSSHLVISYAVFCLKKKKKNITMIKVS